MITTRLEKVELTCSRAQLGYLGYLVNERFMDGRMAKRVGFKNNHTHNFAQESPSKQSEFSKAIG
jgi:hypothetical protein